MSTQRVQGVLLFLVLAINFAQFQILRSYSCLITLPARSYALLVENLSTVKFQHMWYSIIVITIVTGFTATLNETYYV